MKLVVGAGQRTLRDQSESADQWVWLSVKAVLFDMAFQKGGTVQRFVMTSLVECLPRVKSSLKFTCRFHGIFEVMSDFTDQSAGVWD